MQDHQEWKRCLLGDVITLQRGYDLPERERQYGNVPIVSSSGVTGHHNSAKVKGPGVVTGRYGTLGEVFYIEENFWPLNTTLFVRDFKGNSPLFISYFLRTLNLAHQNGAGAVPGVNRNALHLLPVRVPSLSIQRTIATILSAYDDLIENNTRRIAILEEMAQMLYQEWFVKFRFPGHEQATMVESEMGMIPEGWEFLKLGDVIELAYGKALKADTRLPGNIPVYGSAGIVGYHQEKLVDGPGIIVGRKGNVGSVFWANSDFYPIDTVFYVRTELSLYYIYYNLRQQHFINNDAAVPGLSRHQAYSLPFIRPSDTLLRSFEDFVKPVFFLKTNLIQRGSILRRTRDRLLPKLISGEIDVSSWVEGGGEAAALELAGSVAGGADVYERGRQVRRVAESGPVAPIDKEGMGWESLWE
ncbi:MAG: restriction endonuclease subunit S [Ktedonobacteraceae bacterium]